MPGLVRTSVLLACVAMLSVAGIAAACKYSVRDVAFVDIMPDPYHVYIHVDAATPADTRAEIETASRAIFLDANVDAEIIDLVTQPDHPSARWTAGPTPRIVLESPAGDVLALPPGDGTRMSKDDVWAAVEAVATSRARRQIRRRMFDAHTIIIVVEGSSDAANRQAARIAGEATERVRATMDELPKPIAKPPYTLVIPADRRDEEAVLLWSLGVDLSNTEDAHVAVLFGRMRLLATPLRIPGATEADLFRYLDLVGQDCECTLDRSWMQGTMAPHYWDTHDETMALNSLGFDPGNPLVIAEVSRIVNKPTALTDGRAPSAPDDGALGYSELVIGDGPDASDASAAAPEAPRIEAGPRTAEPSAAAGGSSAGVPLGATAAVLVVVALAGGAFVLARSRRGL